jgi:hypothetical protein
MPAPTNLFRTRSPRTKRRAAGKPRSLSEAEYLRARERLLFGSLGPASPAKRIDPRTGAVVAVIDPVATVVLSDQDLIGIQFAYVDGHVCEVIGVDPATPGAIQYRDLTNGIEGVLLSVYVRRAKQRQHLENQHLENMEREGSRSIEVTD